MGTVVGAIVGVGVGGATVGADVGVAVGFGMAVGGIGSDVEAVLSDTVGPADVGVLAGGKVCPLSQAAKAISKVRITRADPAAAVRSRNFISSSRICYSRKSITPRPSKGRAAVVWQENRDPRQQRGGGTQNRPRTAQNPAQSLEERQETAHKRESRRRIRGGFGRFGHALCAQSGNPPFDVERICIRGIRGAGQKTGEKTVSR